MDLSPTITAAIEEHLTVIHQLTVMSPLILQVASASPQEFLCMPLGAPRSSVASRPGWSVALPGKRHCTTCLEEVH